MKKLIKFTLLAAVAMVSTGCAVVDHTIAKDNVQKKASALDRRFDTVLQPRASERVSDNEGIWVNKKSVTIKEEQLPAVFRSALSIGFETRSSLRDVANMVSRETGIRFSFAPDIIKEAEVQTLNAGFRSEGDLRAVLGQLTAQSNMSWKYRGGSVEIYRFDTQVFQIAVLPGATDVTASVGNRSTSGGNGTSTSTAGQDVKYQIKLEFWRGLQNDIKNLMSRDGKDGSFTVSESTNSITVTGTPPTLAAVESYVKDMNATRTRQVVLDVRAYTVDSSSSRDFGMSWDAAFTNLAKDLGITSIFPVVTPPGVGSLTAILGKSSTSPFAGTKLLANALSTLGNANLTIESSQMVLSGEAIPVNSMREESYIASYETVVGAGTVAQFLPKPGKASAGFSLTVLPIVLSGDTILIKGLLDQSSLVVEQKTTPQGPIGLPNITSRSLPMSVSLKSGETYVYGLREAVGSADDSGITGTALINTLTGGQHGSKENRKTIIVTVTPYIVNSVR